MRYSFLECEVDTRRHEFRSGGAVRRLEPQVFDLLRYLVENPGRLISREELIDAIWGGRIVSEATISSRINAVRKAVGDDGERQAVIRTVPRRGLRFVADVRSETPDAAPVRAPAAESDAAATGTAVPAAAPPHQTQRVRYCRAPDGTRIAFAISGAGPPLVRVGHWLTHLEHDWRSPIWRPFIAEISRSHTLLRYDQRGNGLSDRDAADLSLDAFVADLEAVIDAAGLESFALYATSQGVPVAIEYAARHEERLTGIVLHGGYYRGRLLRSKDEREQAEAYLALMRHGWAAEGSQFLQAFASIFMPDGTPEQIRSLVELQKISADADTAVRLRRAFDSFDVAHRLEAVRTPALIIHARNDGVHPLQQSLDMAAALPNAELVVLESRDHVLARHEPAWQDFFAALGAFLPDGR